MTSTLLILLCLLAILSPVYGDNITCCSNSNCTITPIIPPPPPPTTIPVTPTGFQNINNGVGTGGQITFVWDYSSDATMYTISYSAGVTTNSVHGTTTSTSYIMGQNPMFTYTVYLVASNMFGNSDPVHVVIPQRQFKI